MSQEQNFFTTSQLPRFENRKQCSMGNCLQPFQLIFAVHPVSLHLTFRVQKSFNIKILLGNCKGMLATLDRFLFQLITVVKQVWSTRQRAKRVSVRQFEMSCIAHFEAKFNQEIDSKIGSKRASAGKVGQVWFI